MIKIKTSCGQRFISNKENVLDALDEAKRDYVNFYVERGTTPSKIIGVIGVEDYSKSELNDLYEELLEEIENKKDQIDVDDQEDVVEGFRIASEEAWNLAGGGK